MPKKHHKPEHIIGKLRDADAMLAAGKTIGQACQSLEISEQTFHRWRAQYGGMKAEEAKRLKHLEEENKRLKKLLAEAEQQARTARLSGLPPDRPHGAEAGPLRARPDRVPLTYPVSSIQSIRGSPPCRAIARRPCRASPSWQSGTAPHSR